MNVTVFLKCWFNVVYINMKKVNFNLMFTISNFHLYAVVLSVI